MRKLLRRDNGTLTATIAFIIIATLASAAMLSWYLLRQTQDYTQALQAKARSSVQQTATNLLGQLNRAYDPKLFTLSAQDLATATQQWGSTPELQAMSTITFLRQPDSTTGVIVAEIVGTSMENPAITAKANVKFVPSGAAVFTGLDPVTGRPIWRYSSTDINALALWQLAPNGIQFITPTGSYDAQAPASPPVVSIVGTSAGATATVSSVYCTMGGTAQYQWQSRPGSGSWSTWTAWATTQQQSFTLVEGQMVEVEARARCVTSLNTSSPSVPSAAVSYTKPITTVFAGPQVNITTAGVVSWGNVSCSSATMQQFRYQSQVNSNGWSTWSAWGTVQTFTMQPGQGQFLEAQVQARCANQYVVGPPSSNGYGSVTSPISYVPAAPSVVRSTSQAGRYDVSSTATCPSGTVLQWSYQVARNGGAFSSPTVFSSTTWVQLTEFEGSTLSISASVRCASSYTAGAASPVGPVLTYTSPVTSIPSYPVPSFAQDGSSFSWSASTCPAGTAPYYAPQWQTNGSSTWSTQAYGTGTGPVGVSVYEGGQIVVQISAYCQGYTGVPGPTITTSTYSYIRPFAHTPSAASIGFNSDSSSWWGSSGCGPGNDILYQWRIYVNSGPWTAFSGWTYGTSLPPETYEGGSLYVGIYAACHNPQSGTVGPVSYGQSGQFIRAVDYPPFPTSVIKWVSGRVSVYWNPAACPTGTTPEYTTNIWRDSPYVNYWSQSSGGTVPGYFDGWWPPYGTTIYFDLYSRCNGAYVDSQWAARRAEWVGDSSTGYPQWTTWTGPWVQ